jgi:hypothetical protein
MMKSPRRIKQTSEIRNSNFRGLNKIFKKNTEPNKISRAANTRNLSTFKGNIKCLKCMDGTTKNKNTSKVEVKYFKAFGVMSLNSQVFILYLLFFRKISIYDI